MSVDLTHPLVADYLHRLETAAAVLPVSRRTDLVAEIREHLTDALAGTGAGVDGAGPDGAGPDGEAVVRAVLDRLGTPDEIVAAETPGAGDGGGGFPAASSTPVAGPPFANTPRVGVPIRSGWGPVEVIAVVALTLGTFLLPIVGPLVGVACAWSSPQWTRREKWVATIWGLVTPVLLMGVVLVGLVGFFVAAVPVTTVEPVPASVVVEQAPLPVPVASEMLAPGPTELVTP